MYYDKEELKELNPVQDVIAEHCAVKNYGAKFKCNCPFHIDEDPSLVIYPETQSWHCFGCGKGGEVFNFIMELKDYSFIEACEFLAERAANL